MQNCQSILNAIPLDRSEIPQGRLNIEAKERSNLLPWNGQFSPQFVDTLLEKYASPDTHVLDPFSGSGTVLHECARYGLAVTGIDVNPAAYILSKTYALCNVQTHERRPILAAVDAGLARIIEDAVFAVPPADRRSLTDIAAQVVKRFQYTNGPERTLFEALIILVDFYKGVDAAKLQKTWAKLRNTVLALPYSSATVQALLSDGRYPPTNAPFDLVLSSPPYINVYNYHQQYRASAEALGWDLLRVARTEIGSNRKNRGNRFLTVIQYCLDLALLLENLWDTTSANARHIFVLGRESRVRGVPFLNGEIFARLAVEVVGYRIVLRQERVFMNRFGQHIYEDIIHLEKGVRHQNTVDSARDTALFLLQQSVSSAGTVDVREDIERAIAAAAKVQSSPRFDSIDNHSDNTLRTTNGLSDTTSGEVGRRARQRQAATV